MEKIKLKYPVVVEGRYDKVALSSIFDAVIITTGGFSVFNSKEKLALIKKLGGGGIILLTDSDAGGRQIRSYLHSALSPELVHDAYIPKIRGKERRKKSPSRSGTLGVEGVGREVLVKALSPYSVGGAAAPAGRKITKTDLYLDGLSGADDASAKRARLLSSFDLPDDMTANAMLEALNMLVSYEEYKSAVEKIK
jgi:ribonuclease M5